MIWPSLHGCLEISSPTFTKEAKTQNVHLRPYHDPTKLKSREDVEMRILYKGVGLVGMQGRACRWPKKKDLKLHNLGYGPSKYGRISAILASFDSLLWKMAYL